MMGIESVLGYTFTDEKLLERALTLSSYDNDFNNQTLEFFGDAILEFIVTDKLFSPEMTEGELTEMRQGIVSDKALTVVSNRLGLGSFLKKDPHDSNNKKAIPSVYEALVAAIYLDGGMDCAKKFVLSTLDFTLVNTEKNYKGDLQELLQSHGGQPPEYKVKNIGTAIKPMFEACVTIDGIKYSGRGENKRQATQAAAKSALEGNKDGI